MKKSTRNWIIGGAIGLAGVVAGGAYFGNKGEDRLVIDGREYTRVTHTPRNNEQFYGTFDESTNLGRGIYVDPVSQNLMAFDRENEPYQILGTPKGEAIKGVAGTDGSTPDRQIYVLYNSPNGGRVVLHNVNYVDGRIQLDEGKVIYESGNTIRFGGMSRSQKGVYVQEKEGEFLRIGKNGLEEKLDSCPDDLDGIDFQAGTGAYNPAESRGDNGRSGFNLVSKNKDLWYFDRRLGDGK